MPYLLFFCGHAGVGKTTLAKRMLAPLRRATGETFCVLDKDTLYGQYSSAVMGVLTGDVNDRDSPLYLQHLRDPEYRGLLDTARENLALGVSTAVIGPLSREIHDGLLADRKWLGVADDVTVRTIWVYTDESTARSRIVARGEPKDAYKLANWDGYRARRFEPDPQAHPELLRFDNTAPSATDYDALLRAIV